MQGGDVVVVVDVLRGEWDSNKLLSMRGRRVRGEGVVSGGGRVEKEKVGGCVRWWWRVRVVDVGSRSRRRRRRRVHENKCLKSISRRRCLDF